MQVIEFPDIYTILFLYFIILSKNQRLMGKNEHQYEVDAIIGKRRKKNSGSIEYRVLWKGYPKEQSTWEPEEHLENVQYMIDEFNKKIQERASEPQKKEVPPTHPSLTPPKKIQQEIPPPPVQETKRKDIPQKPVKRVIKDSDEDYNQHEEKTFEEVKVRGPTAQRGKPSLNKIQQEPKYVERKIAPPSFRNGIKPSTLDVESQNGTEIKRPISSKIDNEKLTSVEEDPGFSSDEEVDAILQVTGIFMNENGKIGFAVHEKKNNRRTTLRRRQVIKKDPLALIRFYEKSFSISG